MLPAARLATVQLLPHDSIAFYTLTTALDHRLKQVRNYMQKPACIAFWQLIFFSLHRQPAGASAQRTTKRSTCHGLKVEWDTVHAVGAYVADPSDVEPSSCQSHRPSFAGIVKEAASKIIVYSCLQRALYVFVVFCRRYSSSDGLVPCAAIETVFVHTYTRRLHTMYGL